jgi:hypothetical protein
MQKSVFRAVVCVCVLASAQVAAAQTWQFAEPWTDRGYVNINGGFESVSGQLNDATTRSIYGEEASLSVSQAIDSGSFFDFSVGARVWRNVSAGIAYHAGGTHSEASIEGSIPHPLFFNRLRGLALTATDLERSERAVHLQFGYMLPLTDRINVHVTLGPSFFTLRQDVVADVTLQETGGSFNTLNATPDIVEREDSPVGFNIGADVSFTAYTRDQLKLGAGMFVRYAGASADVELFDDVVDSDVGGLQVGFGVRVRF